MLTFAADVGHAIFDGSSSLCHYFMQRLGAPICMPLVGAKLVFPGAALDGASLFSLMDRRVKAAWGVPTIWLGLLAEMRKQKRKPQDFSFMLSGGSGVQGQ